MEYILSQPGMCVDVEGLKLHELRKKYREALLLMKRSSCGDENWESAKAILTTIVTDPLLSSSKEYTARNLKYVANRNLSSIFADEGLPVKSILAAIDAFVPEYLDLSLLYRISECSLQMGNNWTYQSIFNCKEINLKGTHLPYMHREALKELNEKDIKDFFPTSISQNQSKNLLIQLDINKRNDIFLPLFLYSSFHKISMQNHSILITDLMKIQLLSSNKDNNIINTMKNINPMENEEELSNSRIEQCKVDDISMQSRLTDNEITRDNSGVIKQRISSHLILLSFVISYVILCDLI